MHKPHKATVDIIIVGGGLAGLAAALECHKANCSFVVLEARDRPGGRIYSIHTDDGIPIDLGAQWIRHDHHRMRTLLRDFGLHTAPSYTKGQSIYDLKGRRHVSTSPLSLIGMFDLFLFKLSVSKLIQQLPDGLPFPSKLATRLDQQSVEHFLENRLFSRQGRAYYKMITEEVLCTKATAVSALDLMWCIKATGSNNVLLEAEEEWIVEGAHALTQRIADSLSPNVYYQSPVENIWDQGHTVQVFTRNQCWIGQKVIVTVPPNLTHTIQFNPPLPAIRTQCCEQSIMPAVIKAAVVYSHPFWRQFGLNGKVLSNQGPLSFVMDSSPPYKRRGILTVILTGERALLMEPLDASARKQQVIQALVGYFGKQARNPLEYFEKVWTHDEWTRGGYGIHYPKGVLTKLGRALFDPVSSIYWAGTEAATEWRMYMEGAVESGQRAAHHAMNALQKSGQLTH